MIERYSRPRMTRVWSSENKLDQWLAIELLALEALKALGQIPEASLERIREKARYDLARINQIEQEVKHDVIAFLTNVSEYVGEDARYLHYGMTSSDILDTGLSLQLREAADLILEGIDGLSRALETKAREHQYTPMIGRTHGVHAEPTTFGLKLAGWYQEVQRSRERLVRAREGICVGKISGAVGTYAHIPPLIERYVCERLGLQPAPTSTQILQRDRHAELLTTLAILASSLEKFALEIRHLQRTEVQEAEEFFGEGQKGSSAMPHKRNPITAEQVCGLARLIRSYAGAALEDIPLWHERDISHSSVERVILPDSTLLIDYMLAKMTDLVARLQIYPERMRENLQRTGGTPFSQAVMLALIRRGLSREEAYRLVQRQAMEAWKQGMDLKELIERDEEIQRHVTPEELSKCFDLHHHLRYVDEIFQRAFPERNHQPPVVEVHGCALLPDRGRAASLERREKIYEGKAKILYTTEDPNLVIQYFKDDATAFNAQKRGTIQEKGILNNQISSTLFQFLEGAGIETHFVRMLGEREMLVKRLEILPLEVVVRNVVAGSLSQRLGLAEGTPLAGPILEFYYKRDDLGDPMINEYHIRMLELATEEEVAKVSAIALRINALLQSFLERKGIRLIDAKYEFGRYEGRILLGDEISPDGCRFWDMETQEKMDKDRFRRDLGRVEEVYQEVWQRVCAV